MFGKLEPVAGEVSTTGDFSMSQFKDVQDADVAVGRVAVRGSEFQHSHMS